MSKWRVNNAQITFDGRKCEHLKRKAYVDASRDHYTASLEGAQALLELGAAVSIRLNADENNVDELFLLVDELEERFGGKKKPAVYAADMFVGCDREHSAEADRMLYSRLEQLHERIHKAGFLRGNDPRRLRTHRCMVDVPNGGTVVAPDGTLYSVNPERPFEHYEDKNVRIVGIVTGVAEEVDFPDKKEEPFLYRVFEEDLRKFEEE